MDCPRCTHENRSSASFCEKCGSSLAHSTAAERTSDASEGERRQATVLFSDLSGYTAMGECLDPEELDDLVARIKTRAAQIVERHGGIVIQFRGDEVFALFGVPIAHDDDPVRTVRAARELHKMVRSISPEVEDRIGAPLRFHSSVSSGLIITSQRDARDGTIGATGDAINTGARLVVLARPDEILLNPDACHQVNDFFETSALAPLILKGKAEPVQAYRVIKETPVQTRFEAAKRRGLTRFAGRQSELATLHRCLEKAVAGTGQLVTLVGDPGVGKSRLAFEFRHSLDRSEVNLLQGRCQSAGSATPYLPFIDTIRRGLELREEESSDALETKLIANVLALDPALERHLPYYLHLLSISTANHPLPEGLQGIELRNAIETALVSLFLSGSRRRPIVWVVEDWHWADDASIGALLNLVSHLGKHSLMVIAVFRPEYARAWGQHDYHTQIKLEPLNITDTEVVIGSVLGTSRLPAGFAGMVHERTGGNPFFTEEISKALLEQGHVVIENGFANVSGPLETMDLPETVQTTIRARVDRLDRESKEVLRTASVLGREFGKTLLQQVCRNDTRLNRILEHLRAQDLIQILRLVPEPEYMFKHVMTQIVVYETLLHQQRKVLHAAVAASIESLYPERLEEHLESLAYHYRHSAEGDKAIHYLELAGDKAAAVFSLPEARKHYQDAIALIDGQDRSPEKMCTRIDLTLKLAKASHYATSADTLKTLEIAREYAQRIGDDRRLARIAYWMGGVYRMLGNHPRVFAVLSECVALAQTLGDEELQAFSFHVMGRACYLTGEYLKGIGYMDQGIPISERLGNLTEVSYSCGFSADCYAWLGKFDRAFPLAKRSMELALKSGDLSRQGGSNWYLSAVHCMHGDWSEGLEAGNRCVEFARRIGGAYLIGAGISMQGWANYMLGNHEEGIALLKEGFGCIQSSGSLQGTALYASMVADHLALAGMCEETIAYATKALDFFKEFGEGNGVAPAHRALAIAAALESRPDWIKVDWHMNESISAARERGELPHLAITLYRHAGLHQKRGNMQIARELNGESQRLFAEMDMAWWLAQGKNLSH